MKNWNSYSKEHYLFILGQGEKMLNETCDTMNSIQNRGRIQLLFSISSATYFIQDIIRECPDIPANVSYGFIITLTISAVLSIFGIYKYKIWTKGTDPSELFNPSFYVFANTELAELNLIRNEAEQYSERIKLNEAKNKRRLLFVTLSFFALCLSPVIGLIIYSF